MSIKLVFEDGFAHRLKKARMNSGFTQVEVAKELMINQVRLSNYERGIREPDIDTLTQLADFYGVTTDWLIGKGERPEKNHYALSKWDGLKTRSKSFPERLREARQKTGLSQEKVAKFLKIPRSNITKYELGQLQPSLETLIRLTMFYDVTSDWLFGLEEDNPSI